MPVAKPGPVVVVIDSGVAAAHPAFAGRWLAATAVADRLPDPLRPGSGKDWVGWDFVDRDAEPDDRAGHGTHMAGLVVQELGGAGESPVRLVMFRTGDLQHELVPVAEALETVAALHQAGWDIPVVLCAFDYRRRPQDGAAYERFAQAFRKVLDAGVVCVCAAGSGGRNLDAAAERDAQYQAALSHPAMITVAACTDDGQLLAASNFGNQAVALAAPGFAAVAAEPGGGTTAMSGSSQAAARVAGRLAHHSAAAKLRQPKELRAWLLKGVQVHPSLVGRVASAGFLPPVGKSATPDP